MNSKTVNTGKTAAGLTIQLSPQRMVTSPKLNRKKPRKKPIGPNNDELKNMLFDQLLDDPVKKRMVMQLIHDNKALIDEYQRKEASGLTSSPVNQVKKKNNAMQQSPTALMRCKAQNKLLQESAAKRALELEKFQSIVTKPVDKRTKKTLLKSVNAFVEVRDANHVDKSAGVQELLKKMGASISARLNSNCTHVIYKDGSYDTFRRSRELKIPLVSILWLDVLDRTGHYVPHDMFPAIGDHEARKNCDALCEKLEKKRHSMSTTSNSTLSTSRRKTLLPSHTFELDNIPDYIAASQPDYCSSILSMSRQLLQTQTTNTNTNMEVNNPNDANNDSASDTSDAPSDTPLISGRAARKTLAELKASEKLSETLLNSPFIVKVRKMRGNNYFIDKENSPVSLTPPNKNKATGVTFKTPKNNAKTDCADAQSSEDMPATPNTLRKKRTLLHNNLLGVIDETDNSPVSMELTRRPSTTPNINKSNLTKPGRKTIHFVENMELTVIQSNNNDVHVDNSIKPHETGEKPGEGIEKSKEIDRTSISSSNTTKSDDLPTFKPKTLSKRMTMCVTKPSDGENTLKKSDNDKSKNYSSTCDKLSLRISDGPDVNPEKSTETTINSTTTTTTKHTSFNNTSETNISADLSTIPTRRITRRMSTQLNIPLTPPIDIKPKSIRKSSSSGVPSLRLSISEEESRILSNNCDSITTKDTNQSETSKRNENLNNKQVSPVSDLSNKLKNTKIAQPVNESSRTSASDSTNATTSTNDMNTFETASTSYSILESKDSTRTTNETRSKSRVELISDVTRSTKSVPTSSNATTRSSAGSKKRKLRDPDTLSEDSRDARDADEQERREHSQNSQMSTISNKTKPNRITRNNLKKRLDKLNIPKSTRALSTDYDDYDLSEVDEVDEIEQDGGDAVDVMNNDNDFEPRTQKTQIVSTQTQKRNKQMYIVCTRFHSDDKPEFRRMVNELGNFRIEQNVTARTTHLVAMENSRTLNMLRAMSRGIWILRSDWLFESMEAGKWLEEESYEMTEFSPLVEQLRTQRETFGKSFCHDVFLEFGPILVSDSCHPSQKELEDLIILCKGEITSDIDQAKVVIGGIPSQNSKAVHVREVWVLDCIYFGRCKHIRNYLIPRLDF